MSIRDDGGPAFPQLDLSKCQAPGMTLRDWFAGKAIAGILAHHEFDFAPIIAQAVNHAAADAYRIADAMIEARST